MVETKYKDIFINEEDLEIYKKTKTGRIIKLCKWVDSLGYYVVSFRCDGKKYWKRLHRLIAETLIPNPDNLPQVNHKDGNKLNYAIDNLEWCTNSYNTQEAYNNNLYKSKKECPVRAINKMNGQVFEFNSIRNCASELHLNRKTITSILKGDKKTNNYDYKFEYA